MRLRNVIVAALAMWFAAATAPAAAQPSAKTTSVGRDADKTVKRGVKQSRAGKIVSRRLMSSGKSRKAGGRIRSQWKGKSVARRSAKSRGSRSEGALLADPSGQLEQQFQEDLKRLGLTPQTLPSAPGSPETDPAAAAPSHASDYLRFDRDRDGFVSRREYISGRSRYVPVGRRSEARRAAGRQRLNARFGRADADGDGRLSVEELGRVSDPRF